MDGKKVYQLDTESAQEVLKPMRLYVNFRPAVSHCDEAWGCIRSASLPTYAYVKHFNYITNDSTRANADFPYPVFEKDFKDSLKKHQNKFWQFSSIDLIKGNKPTYLIENLLFEKQGLKMIINRDHDKRE